MLLIFLFRQMNQMIWFTQLLIIDRKSLPFTSRLKILVLYSLHEIVLFFPYQINKRPYPLQQHISHVVKRGGGFFPPECLWESLWVPKAISKGLYYKLQVWMEVSTVQTLVILVLTSWSELHKIKRRRSTHFWCVMYSTISESLNFNK